MTLLIRVSDTVHQKIKICLMCLKILYFNFLEKSLFNNISIIYAYYTVYLKII